MLARSAQTKRVRRSTDGWDRSERGKPCACEIASAERDPRVEHVGDEAEGRTGNACIESEGGGIKSGLDRVEVPTTLGREKLPHEVRTNRPQPLLVDLYFERDEVRRAAPQTGRTIAVVENDHVRGLLFDHRDDVLFELQPPLFELGYGSLNNFQRDAGDRFIHFHGLSVRFHTYDQNECAQRTDSCEGGRGRHLST